MQSIKKTSPITRQDPHARSSVAATAFMVLLLALAAAGADKPRLIRFGVSNAGVGSPPRVAGGYGSIAQIHRYLEEEFAPDGIEVRWIFFKGQGPAVNEAMANNQLDFTTLGDLPSIVGRAGGLDTRLVLVTGTRADSYVGVQPGSSIAKVQDLRGKRIVIHKGTATQLLANRVLDRFGLAEKDVRLVNMEPANGKAAFLAGQVDALFGALDLLRLSDAGKARIIWSSKEYPAGSSSGHILVNAKFARAQPDLTYRAVKALVKAAHWASLEANRDSVLKIWGSAGTISTETYRKVYAGTPMTSRLSPQFDPFVTAADKKAVEDAYRFRLIRKPFDVDAWTDRRYVDKALIDLGLQDFWPRFDEEGNPLALRETVPPGKS